MLMPVRAPIGLEAPQKKVDKKTWPRARKCHQPFPRWHNEPMTAGRSGGYAWMQQHGLRLPGTAPPPAATEYLPFDTNAKTKSLEMAS